MKKLIVPVVCLIIGCAAGVAGPRITAQSFGPPAAGAERYDAFCQSSSYSTISNDVAEHGRNGFTVTAINSDGGLVCFQRPAR